MIRFFKTHGRRLGALAALTGMAMGAGYVVKTNLANDCCFPGAACCRPGAACCKNHGKSAVVAPPAVPAKG